MDRKWIDNGQKLDRKWIDNGQKLDRKWLDNGQKLDRKWIVLIYFLSSFNLFSIQFLSIN